MNGDPDAKEADAKMFMDAPPVQDGQFTISGKTTERGLGGETAVSGVRLAIYDSSNDTTPIKETMSNQAGEFSMTIMHVGPLDGYLAATKTGYVDIHMWPEQPFKENNTDANINMITPSNRDFLSSLAGGNQMAGKGLIGLAVVDNATGMPVAGASVSSTPAAGAYKYTGSNGLPSSSATMTSADGVAFMFNAGPGAMMVTATKASMTFKAHAVKAPADKMVLTVVSAN